jgi:hypothetical protein
MQDEDDLREAIANDAGRQGTREEWRTLALELRYQIDTRWSFIRKLTFWAFGIGFILGMFFLWVILRFHLYCSFSRPALWFIPLATAC